MSRIMRRSASGRVGFTISSRMIWTASLEHAALAVWGGGGGHGGRGLTVSRPPFGAVGGEGWHTCVRLQRYMDVLLDGCTTVVLSDRYELGDLGAHAEENWTSMRHVESWVIHVCIAEVTAIVVHRDGRGA